MVRRAGVAGRGDVGGRSPTRKERPEEERVPGLGSSPARPFCNPISEILKMSPRFCSTPDAVNNDVQAGTAAGSHHHPNRWPWPTRWAGAGTNCRTGREGYGQAAVSSVASLLMLPDQFSDLSGFYRGRVENKFELIAVAKLHGLIDRPIGLDDHELPR